MQLRVHLCFVCSPRHFVYQCCLLLTEHRMNDVVTPFSLARHCTSAASQHEFRMRLPSGKKLSQKYRARCADVEARWVHSLWTAKPARDSRSVAIHGRAGHVRVALRTRCVLTCARPCGMARALVSAGPLTRALVVERASRFGCSWLVADYFRFGRDVGVCVCKFHWRVRERNGDKCAKRPSCSL